MKFYFFGREFDFFANEAQFNKFFGYLFSYLTPAVICAVLVVVLYGFLLVFYKKRKMPYHYYSFKRLQFVVPLFVLIAFKLLHNIGSVRTIAYIIPDMFAGTSYYHETVVLSFLINILLYTAYGYYIAVFYGRELNSLRICLTVVITSFCSEVLQFILASGNTSVLEIIASFIGAALGLFLHAYNYHLFRRKPIRVVIKQKHEKLYENTEIGLYKSGNFSEIFYRAIEFLSALC